MIKKSEVMSFSRCCLILFIIEHSQTLKFYVSLFEKVVITLSSLLQPGPWSEALRVQSGSAPPEIPHPPQATVSPRSPPTNNGSNITVLVSWVEPASNGSPISEYQLQVGCLRPTSPSPARSTSPSTRPVSPASSVSSNSTTAPIVPASPVRHPRPLVQAPLDNVEVMDAVSPVERRTAYTGSASSTEIKNLLPATTYHFRVQVMPAFFPPIVCFIEMGFDPSYSYL